MTPKGTNGDVESFKAYPGFMISCTLFKKVYI